MGVRVQHEAGALSITSGGGGGGRKRFTGGEVTRRNARWTVAAGRHASEAGVTRITSAGSGMVTLLSAEPIRVGLSDVPHHVMCGRLSASSRAARRKGQVSDGAPTISADGESHV